MDISAEIGSPPVRFLPDQENEALAIAHEVAREKSSDIG
jgi:hypothetical protein